VTTIWPVESGASCWNTAGDISCYDEVSIERFKRQEEIRCEPMSLSPHDTQLSTVFA
jgi:hypothetical protein